MFVVMKVQDFEFEAANFPLPVNVDVGKMKGFLPVYETLEDAVEEYPDSDYVEVQDKTKAKER